jgi:hypothetical protein
MATFHCVVVTIIVYSLISEKFVYCVLYSIQGGVIDNNFPIYILRPNLGGGKNVLPFGVNSLIHK